MELFLLFIGCFTAGYLFLTAIEFVIGFNKIKNLSKQNITRSSLPSISVILTVLNEEKSIENVITALFALDYPALEIIAVNDRSTDATPDILDRLKQKYPQLNVHHIQHLPNGWLGKNHALHMASQLAKGEWILFTDADVIMKKDTLLKTISYVLENNLDHLTIHETHFRDDFWLKISLLGNYMGYILDMKPWRISYSWSKKSLGRGVFNLVNRKSYQACGGHKAIAMECLDDLKLGELIKKNGYKQDIVNAQDYVTFNWYDSLKAMIKGLEKNGFSYFNYRLFRALMNVLFGFAFFVWPVIAAVVFTGLERWINILVITLSMGLTAYVAKQFRIAKRYALFYPVAMLILLYTILNSVFKTYKNKGVIWRGTHYPIEALRNKIEI